MLDEKDLQQITSIVGSSANELREEITRLGAKFDLLCEEVRLAAQRADRTSKMFNEDIIRNMKDIEVVQGRVIILENQINQLQKA